jgi:hypothetical protein
VQGNYLRIFEQRIGDIFQVAFENASRESERKALIKLIQVWQLFINPSILAGIYNRLGLNKIVIQPINLLNITFYTCVIGISRLEFK